MVGTIGCMAQEEEKTQIRFDFLGKGLLLYISHYTEVYGKFVGTLHVQVAEPGALLKNTAFMQIASHRKNCLGP